MGMQEKEGEAKYSRSGAEVLDMETLEQVAEYDASTAPHEFARDLAGIGRLYNEALIAPEVQSSGGGGGREIIVYLREKYGYYNIHRWNSKVDAIQRTPSHLLGWECVMPWSKILTADLRWVEASQIKAGQKIVGCEEHGGRGKGSAYRLKIQTVTNTQAFTAPCVVVELENGAKTAVSTNHPFWTTRPPAKHWRWRCASELLRGDRVRYLRPWGDARSYEAGKLAGFIDGEGHLAVGKQYGFHLLISQAVGPTADEIRELWHLLGFDETFKWTRHKKRPHEKPVVTTGVIRLPEVLRALGSLRPNRLLRRFQEAGFGRTTVRSLDAVPVRSLTPVGNGPVVGLTTDPDHTLIADGIVGHNTNARTRPRMLARIREVIMEQSAIIHSRRLLNQIADFGEDDHGHTEALAGRDDLLFAFGIALMSRTENYFVMPKQTDPSSLLEPDWSALGLRVRREETPEDRIRRIMSIRGEDDHPRSFMEM